MTEALVREAQERFGVTLTPEQAAQFDIYARLLAEWNVHCQPPWSERELCDKLRRARRYGREPIAGLLEAQS